MGFTTGFLGGATLTYSVLYLTIYIHKAKRNNQHTILAQSSFLLNSIVEPLPPIPDPPAYEVRRAGLTEQVKDRWNGEIEKLVHSIQTTDWVGVREDAEARIAAAWSGLRETEQVQKLEQSVKDNVDTATDKAKQLSRDTKQNVREAPNQARDQAKQLSEDAENNIRSTASQARDQARKVSQDLRENVSNATDQARQYGRDVKDNLVGASEEVKNKLEGAQAATGQRRLLEIS